VSVHRPKISEVYEKVSESYGTILILAKIINRIFIDSPNKMNNITMIGAKTPSFGPVTHLPQQKTFPLVFFLL